MSGAEAALPWLVTTIGTGLTWTAATTAAAGVSIGVAALGAGQGLYDTFAHPDGTVTNADGTVSLTRSAQIGIAIQDAWGNLTGSNITVSNSAAPLNASTTLASPASKNLEQLQEKIDKLKKLIGKGELSEAEKEELDNLITELSGSIQELLNNIRDLNPEELTKLMTLLSSLKEIIEKSSLAKDLINSLTPWVESGLSQASSVLIEKIGEMLTETAEANPDKAAQILRKMLETLKNATTDPTIKAEITNLLTSLGNIKQLASSAAKSGALKTLIGKVISFSMKNWKWFIGIWGLNTVKDIIFHAPSQPQQSRPTPQLSPTISPPAQPSYKPNNGGSL
jgi:hypothetical protein